MIYRAILASALCLAMLVPTLAEACDAQVTTASGPRNEAYEPFSPDPAIYPLDITIRNRSDDQCELFASIVGESSGNRRLKGSSTGEYLDYEIVTVQGMRVAAEPGASFGLPTQLAPHQELRLRLQVKLPPGQVNSSGHYDEIVRLRFFDSVGALKEERTIPISVRVQPRAQVSIAGTATSFGQGYRNAVLRLGNLENGVSNHVYLLLRSNETVRVNLNSANRGELRSVSNLGDGVPYTLSIDGVQVSLSQPVILTRIPPRSLDGASYRMVATVPEVGNRYAGEYRDVITINVDAAH